MSRTVLFGLVLDNTNTWKQRVLLLDVKAIYWIIELIFCWCRWATMRWLLSRRLKLIILILVTLSRLNSRSYYSSLNSFFRCTSISSDKFSINFICFVPRAIPSIVVHTHQMLSVFWWFNLRARKGSVICFRFLTYKKRI